MLMPSLFGKDLFDDFFDDGFRVSPVTGEMKTDIREMENGYEITMDMPGVDKENIKAVLKNGYLTVSATTNSEKKEDDENGRYIRRERISGTSSRSFYVGEGVRMEDVKAKFENGVLQIDIPKESPKQIEENHLISID